MEIPTTLSAYTRVLKLASTPSWEEFSRVAIVAGAGIALVGLLGFLVFIVMMYLPGA
ncbi:MAG: protein translocase SEC61 complex subunit gamma [Halobacteriaceae archaeon]